MSIVFLSGCSVPPARTPTPPATTSAERPAFGDAPTPAAIGYPEVGPGTYAVNPLGGPVVGHGGRLLRYRVAVEDGITGVTAQAFAEQVSAVLDDPRSWTGTGQWRLQRVPAGSPYDFTIVLATPATRDALCRDGYDRWTSCRKDDWVVLNVARWVHGAPSFGDDLAGYREYMINHETGHRLYHGHELCPGPGSLAPVMQQQSLGLHGCRPNGWPLVDGRPYHGVSGQYGDTPPPA